MRSPWEHELTTICRAVEFDTSLSSCTFAGAPLETSAAPDDSGRTRSGDPSTQEAADLGSLFTVLSHAIYVNCHVREFTGVLPEPSPIHAPDFVPDGRFAIQLSQANQSRSGWEAGWEVFRIGKNGDIQVRNGDRCRAVSAGHYAITAGPALAPDVGDYVSLQVLRESFQIQPWFYFAFGETLGDQYEQSDCVRFYFHLDPEGAPQLLESMTTALNRFQIAFKFKCLRYREHYYRVDAAVLYTPRRYFDIVHRLVKDCAPTMDPFLRPSVPLFTKRIRAGVGVADDPGGDRSFGQSRCDLIAAAILDVRRDGPVDPQAFMTALRQRFASQGLSFERPHLNPRRVDLVDSACEAGGDS